MSRTSFSAGPAHVVLVAREPPRSLLDALRRAAIRVEAVNAIIVPDQLPARATGIVWFADDYPAMAVVGAITHLRARRPGLRVVLVSDWPEELSTLCLQATGRVAPVVLRRPVLTDLVAALGGPREGAQHDR